MKRSEMTYTKARRALYTFVESMLVGGTAFGIAVVLFLEATKVYGG